MATRLYLTNLAQPGKMAAPAGTVARLFTKEKGGAATSIARIGASGTLRYVAYFLSPPVRDARTFSGTCDFCVGVGGNTNVDYFLSAVDANADINTTSGAPTSGENVLFQSLGTGGGNSPNPAAGYTIPGGLALASEPRIEAGQRLLFTVQQFGTGTTTLHYGGVGTTDITSGNTNVTTRPGWVELSENVVFNEPDGSFFF